MAVDIKAEVTRPIALLLAALATLGWVLFMLTSWSSASTQKAQRVRIGELTEHNERISADLARQVEATGALADLQKKVATTREELTRISQARTDVQADLLSTQRNLAGLRRELTDADRNLQSQTAKLSDLMNSPEVTASAGEVEPVVAKPSRRGRRYSRRGRRR